MKVAFFSALALLLLAGAGCVPPAVQENPEPVPPVVEQSDDCNNFCDFVCAGKPEPTGCMAIPMCACPDTMPPTY